MNPTEKQTIVPAIIPQSLTHLMESLERVKPFARAVQIDIVDGVFVPPVSWPYADAASPHDMKELISGFDVEVDLMIAAPEKTLSEYLDAGVSRVVIHLESTNHMGAIIALKNARPFLLGLSILNDTDLSSIEPYVMHADYVQLMGIAKIGSQGAPFDERVLDRVRALKTAYPSLMVSIDGSVNEETLLRLKAAGATRFAVGSAIMAAEHPEIVYARLTELAG